jgi:hypothetical protein
VREGNAFLLILLLDISLEAKRMFCGRISARLA